MITKKKKKTSAAAEGDVLAIQLITDQTLDLRMRVVSHVIANLLANPQAISHHETSHITPNLPE